MGRWLARLRSAWLRHQAQARATRRSRLAGRPRRSSLADAARPPPLATVCEHGVCTLVGQGRHSHSFYLTDMDVQPSASSPRSVRRPALSGTRVVERLDSEAVRATPRTVHSDCCSSSLLAKGFGLFFSSVARI